MEKYWKVKEVAAVLQISVQTVYRYVANGEMPFHKLNRAVRFKPSEIERWIESKMPSAMITQNENPDSGLFSETKPKETKENACNAENEGGEV